MTHSLKLMGAVALGIALGVSCAQAQTVHHKARHPAPAGRQIIVRERGVEPWLTLGTWAPVGSRNGYVNDTFRPPQRDAVQNTFVDGRGLEYLPNQHSLPESNRPLLIVSWPGSGDPLLSLY
jgi:hypothetical protein